MPEFPVTVLRGVSQVSDPPALTNNGKLYTKSASSVVQAHYRDDAGTITQLTPPSLSNGVVTAAMLQTTYTISNTVVMSTATGAQSLFSAAWGSLISGVMYRIRGRFALEYAGIASLHAINFTLGGSWTNLVGIFESHNTNILTTGNEQSAQFTVPTSTLISSAGTALRVRHSYFNIFGTPSANLTLWPTISFSIATTVVPTLTLGQVEITPIGTSSFTNQGGWT